MISQLTIFLENRKGHLASATRAISDAGINMHALYLADTEDFGVARILCDTPERAKEVLVEGGFRAAVTKVIAVELDDEPGSLATLLELCDDEDMNVEYAYCFIADGGKVIDVLKIGGENAESVLAERGYKTLEASSLYTE